MITLEKMECITQFSTMQLLTDGMFRQEPALNLSYYSMPGATVTFTCSMKDSPIREWWHNNDLIFHNMERFNGTLKDTAFLKDNDSLVISPVRNNVHTGSYRCVKISQQQELFFLTLLGMYLCFTLLCV